MFYHCLGRGTVTTQQKPLHSNNKDGLSSLPVYQSFVLICRNVTSCPISRVRAHQSSYRRRGPELAFKPGFSEILPQVFPKKAIRIQVQIVHWACVCAQSLSLVQLFRNPMDHSPPGSSVHGISQARILEWVTISSSRGSSQPRVEPKSSLSPTLAGRFFTPASPGKPLYTVQWEVIQEKKGS